jgi:hypothetical protein
MRSGAELALMALLAACGGGPRAKPALLAVPVEGSSRDLRMLVGNWEGEFVSARHSRRGTIAFSLREGEDTAYGRVLLDGPTPPPACTDPVSKATGPQAIGEIALTVAMVNVGGHSIGGWLRPYRDPELGCWMDTWFEGIVAGDTIEGMYFSNPADTATALRLGAWWAARKR